MSDQAFSLFTLVLLSLTAAFFIARSFWELRIGLRLSGDGPSGFAGLRGRAHTTVADNRKLRAIVREHRRLAFSPGSEINPDLRRLYVYERWFRRCAWGGALLLIAALVLR